MSFFAVSLSLPFSKSNLSCASKGDVPISMQYMLQPRIKVSWRELGAEAAANFLSISLGAGA